jgi:hypothetical protein
MKKKEAYECQNEDKRPIKIFCSAKIKKYLGPGRALIRPWVHSSEI